MEDGQAERMTELGNEKDNHESLFYGYDMAVHS